MGEALDDVLRLRACPGCDYSLETLAAEGVCPECGRAYDGRWVVMSGRGRGRWDGAEGGTSRGLWWMAVALGVLVWLGAGWSRAPGRRDWADVAFQAWLVTMIIVVVVGRGYTWLFAARESRMQLWVSAEGVGQGVSTVEGRRALWLTWLMQWMYQPAFMVAVTAGVPWGFREVVWGLAGVWVAGLAWRAGVRWRADGATDWRPGIWGWGQVERVKVEGAGEGRARVWCEVTRRWGPLTVNKERAVDIEVECSREVAEELERRMKAWATGVVAARSMRRIGGGG